MKDSYAWFRGLVKERRGMDDALLEKVADGRVFTGRQAVELKLIDQLGDEKTAVAWLVAEKKIKSDLPVRDYKLTPRFGDLTFLRTAASITFDALGLSSIARQIEQAGVAQAVDQLRWTACWHCGAPRRPTEPYRRPFGRILPHCECRRIAPSGHL